MLYALVSALYLYVSPLSAGSGDWGYIERGNNVSHWVDVAEECGGLQQSPIDVIFADDSSTVCEEPLTLEWTSESMTFAIRNTGKSLKAIPIQLDTQGSGDLSGLEVLHHTNDTIIRLPNQFYNTFTSNVNKEYCFDSLHFHWGRDDTEGSEHTYNGVAYPLEVHFVHYSCDYYLLGPAVGDYLSGAPKTEQDDQHVLAVIGVVFEIGEANPVLQKMLDDTIQNGIREYHDPTDAFGDHLLELYYTEFDMNGLLPTNKEFAAYKGSLTTPPCLETVRWHNMKTPMTVSVEQMEAFRKILGSMNLTDSQAPNYRPPQPLNDRTIYQCVEEVEAETVEKEEIAVNTETEETTSSSSSEPDTWFIIGIVFICLFAVALMGIAYLYYIAYVQEKPSNDDPTNKYQKAQQQSMDVEALATQ